MTQNENFHAVRRLIRLRSLCAFHVFLLATVSTDAGMPQRIQAAEDGDLRRASPLWLLEDESEMTGS